jgi:hypothetical protein
MRNVVQTKEIFSCCEIGRWVLLCVKAMQMSWASQWEMALSITTTAGLPVPGLQTKP